MLAFCLLTAPETLEGKCFRIAYADNLNVLDDRQQVRVGLGDTDAPENRRQFSLRRADCTYGSRLWKEAKVPVNGNGRLWWAIRNVCLVGELVIELTVQEEVPVGQCSSSETLPPPVTSSPRAPTLVVWFSRPKRRLEINDRLSAPKHGQVGRTNADVEHRCR